MTAQLALVGEAPPPPYPADIRAKGWRLELDHERIRQSDTWVLASPEQRPWLLMLWMTAWEQSPCATLPDDDRLIAARIGMPLERWMQDRHILLRGWTKASDGRLYHETLTQFVLAMLRKKTAERDRKADYRARQSATVPRDKTGTNADNPGNPPSRDDTRTSTSTKETGAHPTSAGLSAGDGQSLERTEGALAGFKPTPAGAACIAMKDAGVGMVNPADPRLLALLEQGATAEEFKGLAVEAVEKRIQQPFGWILKVLASRREEAAAIALAPAAPAAPPPGAGMRQQTIEWNRQQDERTAAAQSPEAKAAAAAARAHLAAVMPAVFSRRRPASSDEHEDPAD